MKKILITGANGFIGRNLVESFEGKYGISYPDKKELNLLNSDLVREYLRKENYDIVIHAANCNDFRHQKVTDFDVLQNNLLMFYNLEKNQSYFGRMYYFGSGAEYDMKHYIPQMKENYLGQYIPEDAYGLSKYVMAKECIRENNIYDLVLFGVYGKYEEWERRFISNNICRCLLGKAISIQQNRYFDYLFIDDLVKIMEWFIENEPKEKRYNICTGRGTDLLSIAKIIKEELHNEAEIEIYKDGFGMEYTGNNQKLLNEMGNYSFEPFEIAIPVLVQFYKEKQTELVEGKEYILE